MSGETGGGGGDTQPQTDEGEVIERFGLRLTAESFEELGRALARIDAAEAAAWRAL